ncbi:unnamed protein product, partial [Lymnaea stagnalis]
MHLLGETGNNSNDNSTMSTPAIDIRLRRQAPVTGKPPPKLRLTSRASTLKQQQPGHRQPRSSSWHPDTATFSLAPAATSSQTQSTSDFENGNRNRAHSYNGNNVVSNAVSGNSRLLIHHQRHNLKNRFQLLKTLGEGTYGKVKLARDKGTGEHVAIKYIKKTKIQDENDLVRIRREIQILSSLRHKHIVNIRE